MIALALALGLATSAAPDDTDLPRSLSLFDPPRVSAPADDFSFWIGGHLGVAAAYDADGPCLVFGANGRMHILPWLGADASIDFQTAQEVDNSSADFFQIPFQFAALFYPTVELPVRPYGTAGVGWTFTTIDPPGRSADTDANLLFFIGFGAEFELDTNLLLDANLRFVFAQDPPHSGDFSADWIQFTVGLMIKLAQ